MKIKKITEEQFILLGSYTLQLFNSTIKEKNKAEKLEQTVLIEYYKKEVEKIGDLLTELKLM